MKNVSTKYLLILLSVILIITSCKSAKEKSLFTVSGKIKNMNAKQVFLEEVNPSTMNQVILDTSEIADDGSFSLKTEFVYEKLYTLRLSNSLFPFATLINDSSDITVIADYKNTGDLYSVEGSALSDTIKYVSTTYPKKWTKLMAFRREYDSLKGAKGAESLIKIVYDKGDSAFTDFKKGIYTFLNTSTSPVFSWYLLRNFQHIFTVEEYSDELAKAEKKFPGNEYLLSARNRLNQQIADAIEKQKEEEKATK
jgi:hypothetical protein